MMVLFLFCSLMVTSVVVAQHDAPAHHHQEGLHLEICKKKYVKPGDDFDISCASDSGVRTTIYPPIEELPSDMELFEASLLISGNERPERTIQINEWVNANKEEHEGWYTCVVQHGSNHDPLYSTGQCEVIIVDLCAENPCPDHMICEADYDEGTTECTCNFDCSSDFEPVCDNYCDIQWNECEMRKEGCKEGVHREAILNQMCPKELGEPIIKPQINQQDMTIIEEYGVLVTLHSGLMVAGHPPAQVYWSFMAEGETEFLDLETRDHTLPITLGQGVEGVYHAKVMLCMDESTAVTSVYRVYLAPPPSGSPFTASPPTDEPAEIKIPAHTCSVFPGGVISDFNSQGHYYDLACTHVLAADLMPGGEFYNPWFIYGTFDQEDGKTALMSMTFYLGRNIFEVQRGWLVHMGGSEKMRFEEGVPRTIGESGCVVTFAEWHMNVRCPHFTAHYDGLMAGHITLKELVIQEVRVKSVGEMGLCFDNQSGRRPNWQVGRTTGRCAVEVGKPSCQDDMPDSCAVLEGVPELTGLMDNMAWARCGMGATDSCGELYCEDHQPTPSQMCSLEQANRVNCDLKQGASISGEDASCPDDKCTWFKRVLARGCPQEHPPFDC